MLAEGSKTKKSRNKHFSGYGYSCGHGKKRQSQEKQGQERQSHRSCDQKSKIINKVKITGVKVQKVMFKEVRIRISNGLDK